MPIEITCALIALAGVMLSTFVSFKASKTTAAKEIEKMKLEWEREDTVSSDDEFAEMSAAVASFVQWNQAHTLKEAAAKVAAIRSKETGKLAEELDTLYDSLRRDNGRAVDTALSNVIKEKRKKKSDQ